jgi:hypothetical protein
MLRKSIAKNKKAKKNSRPRAPKQLIDPSKVCSFKTVAPITRFLNPIKVYRFYGVYTSLYTLRITNSYPSPFSPLKDIYFSEDEDLALSGSSFIGRFKPIDHVEWDHKQGLMQINLSLSHGDTLPW